MLRIAFLVFGGNMKEDQKRLESEQINSGKLLEEKLLFDRLETSQLLNISTVTLYREMRERRISYRRIGDRPFFTKQDINEYLESRKHCAKR